MTPENAQNLWLFDAFRTYKMEQLAENGLKYYEIDIVDSLKSSPWRGSKCIGDTNLIDR